MQVTIRGYATKNLLSTKIFINGHKYFGMTKPFISGDQRLPNVLFTNPLQLLTAEEFRVNTYNTEVNVTLIIGE